MSSNSDRPQTVVLLGRIGEQAAAASKPRSDNIPVSPAAASAWPSRGAHALNIEKVLARLVLTAPLHIGPSFFCRRPRRFVPRSLNTW